MSNEQQIDYWNGDAGSTWVEAQEKLDAMLAPFSEAAIELADPQPGERAIDIGCGCGATAIALAQRGAAVWGVDISEPMLARARQRAEGVKGVAFSRTDAATQNYTPDHSLVFSRFGVMFFDDPPGAFRNIRTGITPGGRLVFVCWQAPGHNPWMAVAGRAVQPFLAEAEAPDPRAPGPFAFADADWTRDMLGQAGFSDIVIDSFSPTLTLGRDLDEVMRFQGQVGPLARALAELDADTREQALAAARAALQEHVTDTGVHLGSAAWLVRAYNR